MVAARRLGVIFLAAAALGRTTAACGDDGGSADGGVDAANGDATIAPDVDAGAAEGGGDGGLTATGGDRHPQTVFAYPPSMFHDVDASRNYLDITKPPFNATGKGKVDDTAAFVAAYDYVLAQADAGGWTVAGAKDENGSSYVIYVPEGEYLVSSTIIYSGPPRTGSTGPGDNAFEHLAQIRFVGMSREKTTIRLVDHAKGFGDPNNPMAVVSFAKGTFNNRVARNAFRNITIDTGVGNPGAIKLDFMGANQAEIRNVTVRSGDGQGVAGIRLAVSPTVGYHRDITVDGFDYGVLFGLRSLASHPVFEHVSTSNQHKAGVALTAGSSASIRDLAATETNAPAVLLQDPATQLVLLDSDLVGSGQAAVDLAKGELFARKVTTAGYADAIDQAGSKAVAGGVVGEWLSGKAILGPGATIGKSLALPILDAPEPSFAPISDWAKPEDFAGGGVVDTAAVQAAFDAVNKSTVYFPSLAYSTNPIDVPPKIERVVFAFRQAQVTLRVAAAPNPLVLEDGGNVHVVFTGQRTVVTNFETHDAFAVQTATRPLQLFINDEVGPMAALGTVNGLSIWGRAVDNEGSSTPVTCDGTDLWILGVKTERGDHVAVTNGGRLEVLGGTAGVQTGTMIRDDHSQLSYVGNTSGFDLASSDVLVTDVEDAGTKTMTASALPPRPIDQGIGVFVPLYADHHGQVAP